MAGRGPVPKGERVRDRDTPATNATVVETDELGGPDLPDDLLAEGEDWHPATRRWYDNVRRLSHMRWEPSAGWDVLLDTALLHHKMWSYNRTDLAAEIRQRTAQFGLTPADRMRLRFDVVAPPPTTNEASGGAVSSKIEIHSKIADRRKRVLAAVPEPDKKTE